MILFIALHANRSENVKAAVCCADEHAGDLRVPMQLFNVLLSLMNKQQLWWNLHDVTVTRTVALHGQVPLCQLVVCAGSGENGRLLRVPLDGRDGSCVMLENAHWFSTLHKCNGVARFEPKFSATSQQRGSNLELAQVPDLDGAVVATGSNERLVAVPMYDVHVAVVRALHSQLVGFVWRGARVPNADGLVDRARSEHLKRDNLW